MKMKMVRNTELCEQLFSTYGPSNTFEASSHLLRAQNVGLLP